MTALITGTSAAPRTRAVQTLRGASAKPSAKGAVEPTKLRIISPVPITWPIGRMARLSAAIAAKARNGQLMALAHP